MGGYGSTRWAWHDKKRTVEDCWAISIKTLLRDGWLQRGDTAGSLWWEDGTGKKLSAVSFTLQTDQERAWLTLRYKFTSGPFAGREIAEPVRLQYTRPNYGGRRWWFTCPLVVNGRACGRRVAKLYLPPGELYYGCRHCYDLTYRSSQEAHKLDRSGSELIRLLGLLEDIRRREQKLGRELRRRRPDSERVERLLRGIEALDGIAGDLVLTL